MDPNIATQLKELHALDFGLTMMFLIVVYKALTIGGQYWLNKKMPSASTLACQADPMHFQRIKEMHEATMDTEKRKQQGDFQCQFKDRDEVRDLLEQMRANTVAIRELTQELKMIRNGRAVRTVGE